MFDKYKNNWQTNGKPFTRHIFAIELLAPEKCGSYFQNITFEVIIQNNILATRCDIQVNTTVHI